MGVYIGILRIYSSNVPLIFLQVCTRNVTLICLDLLLDSSNLIIRLHQVFNRTLYLTFRILLHHHHDAQLHLLPSLMYDKGHQATISDLEDKVGNTPISEDPFKIGARFHSCIMKEYRSISVSIFSSERSLLSIGSS